MRRTSLRRFALGAILLAAPAPTVAGPCDTVTAAGLNAYLAGSALAGLGELFVCKGKRWNVDPRLLVAIAKHETGLGTLEPCAQYNNPFGWFYCGAESCVPPDCTPCDDDDTADIRCQRSPYACWTRAVSQVTKFLGRKYLDAGLTTIPAIKEQFCHKDCDAWGERVERYMREMGGDPAVLRPHCPFPALDDFERSALGSEWTTADGDPGATCAIVNGSDLAAAGPHPRWVAFCHPSAGVPTTAQYACALLSGGRVEDPDDPGVCVGVEGEGRVCCVTDNLSGGYVMSARRSDGFTLFIDGEETATFGAGDYIGIERTSAEGFTCSRSTDGRTWTPLLSKAANGIPDPGHVAAAGAVSGRFNLETWEGGNGALPSGIGRRCGCEDGTVEFECG